MTSEGRQRGALHPDMESVPRHGTERFHCNCPFGVGCIVATVWDHRPAASGSGRSRRARALIWKFCADRSGSRIRHKMRKPRRPFGNNPAKLPAEDPPSAMRGENRRYYCPGYSYRFSNSLSSSHFGCHRGVAYDTKVRFGKHAERSADRLPEVLIEELGQLVEGNYLDSIVEVDMSRIGNDDKLFGSAARL